MRCVGQVARIEANGGEVRQEGPGGRVYAKGKSYPGAYVCVCVGGGGGGGWNERHVWVG